MTGEVSLSSDGNDAPHFSDGGHWYWAGAGTGWIPAEDAPPGVKKPRGHNKFGGWIPFAALALIAMVIAASSASDQPRDGDRGGSREGGEETCEVYGEDAMEVLGSATDGSEDYCTDFVFDYPMPDDSSQDDRSENDGYHDDMNGNPVPDDCGAWAEAKVDSGEVPASDRDFYIGLCEGYG